MINFNTNQIMKLWASHLLIVPVLYALASPGERKQIVRSSAKPDDLELNSAKLVAASVMHRGELRCFSPRRRTSAVILAHLSRAHPRQRQMDQFWHTKADPNC